MKDKPKDPAAVALGQRRWEGVSKKKRSDLTRAAANSRWENASEEERREHGARLAAARKKARAKKTKAAG